MRTRTRRFYFGHLVVLERFPYPSVYVRAYGFTIGDRFIGRLEPALPSATRKKKT